MLNSLLLSLLFFAQQRIVNVVALCEFLKVWNFKFKKPTKISKHLSIPMHLSFLDFYLKQQNLIQLKTLKALKIS
jgi:hypothetical protein